MMINLPLALLLLVSHWWFSGSAYSATDDEEIIPVHPGTFYFLATQGTVISGYYFKDDNVVLLRDVWKPLNVRYLDIEKRATQLENENPDLKSLGFIIEVLLTVVGPDTPETEYSKVLEATLDNFSAKKGFPVGFGDPPRYFSLEEVMASELYTMYSEWYREHYRRLNIWPGSASVKARMEYDRQLCELAKKDPGASVVDFTTEGTRRYIAKSPDIRLRFWKDRDEWLSNPYKNDNPEYMANWFCFGIRGVVSDAPAFKLAGPEGQWIALRVPEVSNDIDTGFFCSMDSCYPKRQKIDKTWSYIYKSRWKK